MFKTLATLGLAAGMLVGAAGATLAEGKAPV